MINKMLSTIESYDLTDLINFLETSSFKEDPASTRHHLSVPGGLVKHTENVLRMSLHINKEMKYDHDSVVLAAVTHDLCKVGSYEIITKWRKDKYNKWESYEVYGYKETEPLLPHGEKSAFMLKDLVPDVSYEILMAVRYHMSTFEKALNVDFGVMSSFNSACTKYPLTRLLIAADFLSLNLEV